MDNLTRAMDRLREQFPESSGVGVIKSNEDFVCHFCQREFVRVDEFFRLKVLGGPVGMARVCRDQDACEYRTAVQAGEDTP